jgi:hypothetical protein
MHLQSGKTTGINKNKALPIADIRSRTTISRVFSKYCCVSFFAIKGILIKEI